MKLFKIQTKHNITIIILFFLILYSNVCHSLNPKDLSISNATYNYNLKNKKNRNSPKKKIKLEGTKLFVKNKNKTLNSYEENKQLIERILNRF
jgi:hypothetical protein